MENVSKQDHSAPNVVKKKEVNMSATEEQHVVITKTTTTSSPKHSTANEYAAPPPDNLSSGQIKGRYKNRSGQSVSKEEEV